MALVCAAVATVLFVRPMAAGAEVDPKEWDGDLIAAGWDGSKTDSDVAGYDIKWVDKDDIDANGLKDGVTGDSEYSDGKVAYIEISSAKALVYFSYAVQADGKAEGAGKVHKLDGAYVKLTENIDLKNKIWIPIGQTDYDGATVPNIRFSGTFDGGGHTISKFNSAEYLNSIEEDGGNYYVCYGENDEVKIPFKGDSKNRYGYSLFGTTHNFTVKNLTVSDVTLKFGVIENAPKFSVYSAGAFVACNTGSLTMENCYAGTPDTDDLLSIKGVNASAVGGVIGRSYSYTNSSSNTADYSNYNPINIKNSYNYVNMEFLDAEGKPARMDNPKVGGFIGFQQFFNSFVVENCENHGDIKGGYQSGGITGYYSFSLLGAAANGLKLEFKILNCDNYGNLLGADGSPVGGILGYFIGRDRPGNADEKTVTIEIDGCSNFGNISSSGQAGGILGFFRIMSADDVKLTDNYNYGNVYALGTSGVAGYISALDFTGTWASAENNRYGNLKLSGGNLGTVYSTAEKTQSLISSFTSGLSSRIENLSDWPMYLVDAGVTVKAEKLEDIPTAPTGHSKATRERYPEAVNADGTYRYQDDTYIYAEEGKSTIIGLKADASISDGKLTIPSTVTKIGYAAFAGHNSITEIDWADSNVTVIEDWAFAGSNLTALTLPENLEKIGAAAFAGKVIEVAFTNVGTRTMTNTATPAVNVAVIGLSLPGSLREIGPAAFADWTKLNYVELSSGIENLAVGKNAFVRTRTVTGGAMKGAFIIAANSAQYGDLGGAGSLADCGGILTHKVTISYYYNNAKIENADEIRLRGQDYNILYTSGNIWEEQEVQSVGPTSSSEIKYVWYYGTDARPIAGISDMNTILRNVNDDSIRLNANVSGDRGKVFIARDNIVYDENTEYDTSSINSLLVGNLSDRVTADMEVKINGDKDGKIKNAGTYTVTIVDNGITYEIEIVVNRKTIDLTDIDWNISKIGEEGVNYQLMTYDRLYIYSYNNVDSVYPSQVPITDDQLLVLGLNPAYSTISVISSAVRNRNNEVTITLANLASYLYGEDGIEYAGNIAEDVGRYSATARFVASSNYLFTVGNLNSLLGMNVSIKDGEEVTVTKTWYIVDFSNWLVAAPGSETDYVLDVGHVYGQDVTFAAPYLRYGSDSDITMKLYLANEQIGATAGFSVADRTQYINRAMPAGNYTLEISVADVWMSTFDASGKETRVYYRGFTELFTFTVLKAELPSISGINDVLQNKEFTYGITDSRIYDENASKVISEYLTAPTLSRAGTIWSAEAYDQYYSGFALEFNLLRAQSDSYSDTIDTSKADTYTVYYRISALNYLSNTEIDSRYNYKFTLIKYAVLDVPTVVDSGLVYTGNKVLPTIAENVLYEVVWSATDDYIAGGTHSVWFKLYDPVHYRWNGEESDTVKVEFTIGKASNDFTVALNIIGWNYGSYDSALNSIRAAVAYLDDGESIVFSVRKKGADTSLNGLSGFMVNKNGEVTEVVAALLNALDAGNYVLYATVEGTENYVSLTRNVEFAVGKAINAWKDGDEDLVLPSWIVGRYKPEENPIVIRALYGNVKFKITDIDANVYYDSTDADADITAALNKLDVGKYLLVAWVDGSDNFASLADRTFTIQIFEAPGLPWWAVILIVVGALGLAALVIFILWKKGVFRIVTDKILLAIRTRVSVEATIASVRAAKKMEEGRKSVAEAKRRERMEQLRQKAKEQREMSPEERAAQLEAKAQAAEAKAQAEAEKAEKARARSEKAKAQAEKKGNKGDTPKAEEKSASEKPEDTKKNETPEKADTPETPDAPDTPETPKEE